LPVPKDKMNHDNGLWLYFNCAEKNRPNGLIRLPAAGLNPMSDTANFDVPNRPQYLKLCREPKCSIGKKIEKCLGRLNNRSDLTDI
jgi:hypothetical protein